MSSAARILDTLSFAFVVGSLAWFFFVQTLVLVKRLGRDRFVPLQLSLVTPLFRSALVAVLVGGAAAFASGASHEALLSAAVAALVAVLLNAVVVPKAVRAGGASLTEALDAAAQQSGTRFTLDGGGEATKVWHRVLGLLTVVLVGAAATHLALASTRAAVEPYAQPAIATSSTAQPHVHPPAEETSAALAAEPLTAPAARSTGHPPAGEPLTTPAAESPGRPPAAEPLTTPAAESPGHPPAADTAGAPNPELAAGRWKSDAPTVAGVRAMQALVKRGLTHEVPRGELVDGLRAEFKGIFQRCTMTGPAHEALHGFLVPAGALIGQLEKAPDARAAAEVLAKLDSHLATFDASFE